MADQIEQDENGRTFKNGVLQTSSVPSANPMDAIHAMIGALAQHFAPRSITQAKQRTDQAVDKADLASELEK